MMRCKGLPVQSKHDEPFQTDVVLVLSTKGETE